MTQTTLTDDSAAQDVGTPPRRVTWKQSDIAALVQHYHNGGIHAARKALPSFRTEEIDAKLVALGLLKMSENDHASVAQIIKLVREADNVALTARAALKGLRVILKEEA